MVHGGVAFEGNSQISSKDENILSNIEFLLKGVSLCNERGS